MKALSFRQPWLWAVLRAGKRIENRKWNTHYRGPILLHASRGLRLVECAEAIEWIGVTFGLKLIEGWPGIAEWEKTSATSDGNGILAPRGGIVGRATIVDVIPPGKAKDLVRVYGSLKTRSTDLRWWFRDQWGLVLDEVLPLPFVPWPGALNLFEVPDDYASRPTPPRRLGSGAR